MKYYKNYNLKNSFNFSCIVNEIWFPENYDELEDIKNKRSDASIVADGTNVVFKPRVAKLISLKKMPSWIYFIKDNDEVQVLVSSNFKLQRLVEHSIENNYSGLEGLYGIPGTIGGAIVGNSGSGEYAISYYLKEITVLKNKILIPFYKRELNFSRRYSILQDVDYIVTNAKFCFPNKKINKKEIEKAKQHRNNFPKYPSVGGIFKNWHELKSYKNELIGLREGGLSVSNMLNIIQNDNNGTYEDFINLTTKILNIVKKPLELEIKII